MNSNIERSERFLSDFALNSVREAANSKWNHTYDISDSVRSISKSLTGITAAIVHTVFFFRRSLLHFSWLDWDEQNEVVCQKIR